MRNVIISILLAIILVGLLYAFNIPVIPLKDLNVTVNETPDLTHMPAPGAAEEDECVACDIPEHMKVPPPNLTLPCNASDVPYPDHETYSGDYISVDWPDYLTESTVDCSLRGRDAEITQDLDEKLAILDTIEDEVDDVEEDADDLLSEGEDALECIREAEHGLESGGMVSAEPSRQPIGGSFPLPSTQTVVLTNLQNFYSSLGHAYTAKSHTDASMDTLESLVEGLQDHCRTGGCLFPEDKDQFELWLEGRHGDAVYYADRTQDFIDDARMYAQNYHDSKDYYITVENCLEMLPQHEELPEIINYTNVTEEEPAPAKPELVAPINETTIIPPSDIAKGFKGVQSIVYVYQEKAKYVVTTKVKRKLLWLFDVDVETVTEVDAEYGSIIEEEVPFWSFLLTD